MEPHVGRGYGNGEAAEAHPMQGVNRCSMSVSLAPKLIVRIIVGAALCRVVSGCTVGMPWTPDTSGTSYHAHR